MSDSCAYTASSSSSRAKCSNSSSWRGEGEGPSRSIYGTKTSSKETEEEQGDTKRDICRCSRARCTARREADREQQGDKGDRERGRSQGSGDDSERWRQSGRQRGAKGEEKASLRDSPESSSLTESLEGPSRCQGQEHSLGSSPPPLNAATSIKASIPRPSLCPANRPWKKGRHKRRHQKRTISSCCCCREETIEVYLNGEAATARQREGEARESNRQR